MSGGQIYLQKVIHLEYEHANNVQLVEEQAQSARTEDEKSFLDKKESLKEEKKRLKAELEERERACEIEIKQWRDREAKEMVKFKAAFEAQYQVLCL